MRQTLLYIPCPELPGIGLPMLGFGWLLIAWLALTAGLLLWVSRTKGLSEAVGGYLPLVAIGGVVIYMAQFIVVYDAYGNALGLPIRGYGVMVLLGLIGGVGLATQEGRRMGLHPAYIWGLAVNMVLVGVIGARIVFVLQYREQFDSVWSMLMVTEGGLVVYGALIGGLASAIVYLVRNKMPILAVADLIVPGMVLGLAFGRIGCLMNGCCWGGLCDEAWWGIQFPMGSPPYVRHLESGELLGVSEIEHRADGTTVVKAVDPDSEAARRGLKPGDQLSGLQLAPLGLVNLRDPVDPAARVISYRTNSGERLIWGLDELPAWSLSVQPTQLFSSINAFLLCFMLWALYPLRRRDGQIFALGLGCYAISRTALEAIRNDEPEQYLGLTFSQWISIGMLMITVALLVYTSWQKKGSALPALEPERPA
ncbi:MAG TPA: hypothetical protein DCY79_17215 [Planctomycetaceae bacterium]|nr:hypothetical protein [Blastopirellula sp.]HAY81545.1 hypothetical protein [Planctomycetaceae bacterium]